MALMNRLRGRLSRAWLARQPLDALQARLRARGGVTGLCYHAISDGYPDYDYKTSPRAFESHLAFLAETFEILPLAEILARRQAGTTGDRPLAFLSFDDAYRDNLTVATPLLEKAGLPATLFAPRDLVRRAGATHLTEAELRIMAAHPLWTLGSHGVTHNPLPALAPEDIETELTESRAWLEDVIGREVDGIAYPLGAITPKAIEAARRSYRYGVTTDRRLADSFDPLQIRRYCPVTRDDDLHGLARALLLAPHEP